MIEKSLMLPLSLRSEFSNPLGELMKGTPAEVSLKLIPRYENYDGLLITVGDVVSTMFVEKNVNPHLIITDGATKREPLEIEPNYKGFTTLHTSNPPAEITKEAWETIQYIIQELKRDSSQHFHLRIHGEEDLLVIPAYLECGNFEFSIIYGQPNEGAVILTRTLPKRFKIEELLQKLKANKNDGNQDS